MPAKPPVSDEQVAEVYRRLAREGRFPTPGEVSRRITHETGFVVGDRRIKNLIAGLEAPPGRAGGAEPPPDEPPARAGLRDWSDYPRLQLPALVISDLHVPYHDPAWLKRVVEAARARRLRRLVVNGDLIDSKQLGKFKDQSGHTLEEELELASKLLEWLHGPFDEIHVLLGNHDVRVSKALDNQLTPRRVLQWAAGGNAMVYDHHHAYLGAGWLVAHPGNYSVVPGKPAYELAAKHQKHVLIGHTHKLTLTRDLSGRHWAVEGGMMADPRLFAYTHAELRKFPYHQQGAVILTADEKPVLLSPELG
jgi:predicted phosphodiesterase